MLRPDRKKERQDSAKARNRAWRKKSPSDQLKALNERLGEGIGAKKQRKRIAGKIAQNNQKPEKQ